MRTRSEQIVVQKSGISKTAEDLIKVVNVDQPTQAASETQVIDKLHAFFVALEYLNVCEFSTVAGSGGMRTKVWHCCSQLIL